MSARSTDDPQTLRGRGARKLGALRAGALCALFAIAAPLAAQSAPTLSSLGIETPHRVLFVGNSYLYYGDSLHNHVRRMAVAADKANEKAYQYKSITISGGSLIQHDVAHYLKPGQLGIKEPFDVVVMQGGSLAPLVPKRSDEFRAAVKKHDAAIRASGAKTALYLTHAYVKPHKRADPGNIAKNEKLYVETGNEVGALVIPVGLAFEEAYRRKPGIQLHKTFDGSHPDLIGTYLAACVVYTSLYGKPSKGSPYDYYGKIDKEMASFLQTVADDTVKQFLKR